ncbi:MAG TPA: TonB-dependent receptor [Candidatus Saccharimonadales bacterium]|nr:TonB-dependent receptor [Candidatus Saccharimonadales bacterium]
MERASGLKGALLALVGVFFVAAPLWAGTTGKLEGVITDAKTGKPVPFANITIPTLQRGAMTDDHGYYFLLNIPAGRHTVRFGVIGYEPITRPDVTIIPDFSTQLNIQLNPTTATTLKETVVTGERPLVQRDATGSVRVITGDDIEALPSRGYRDAVAQQAGVVTQGRYSSDVEAQNSPSLYLRGGRSNSVAYYVDGFSTQDPLTGTSSTAINQNAVLEVATIVGGFNAEYGRVSSGIVNVITKEGGKTYGGTLEFLTDYGLNKWSGARTYGNLVYNGSFSGPVIPGNDKLTFYLAGEVRNNRDRSPRPNIVNPLDGMSQAGILPGNTQVGLTWQGKVAWRPDSLTNVKFSLLGSKDDWQRYLNEYRYDIDHTPRYHDFSNTGSVTLNRTLSSTSFMSAAVSYSGNQRVRGDGVYMYDLLDYSANFRGDNANPLYVYNNDFLQPGHVWDDFFNRKGSYYEVRADYTNQLDRHHTVKVGADLQRHTLRFYEHLYPTRLGYLGYDNTDVVNYGFDAFGRETDADFLPDLYDSLGVLVPRSSNLIDNRDNQAKHPVLAAGYIQDKMEYEGLVANVGLRWDYLAPRTKRLADPSHPLDSLVTDAQGNATYVPVGHAVLTDAQAATKLSPRLGVSFPVTDKTDFRFNYGLFYQLPNLQDLYTNYDYLTYKVTNGGYYYAFGNPNLEPERTTQMEVGFVQQLTERSALDVAVWYKDVQGLEQVKNIPAAPNGYASFRNTDFGTLRGIDFNYTLRRSGHLSGSVSYTISWARGTGSNPQSQRNIAWQATEEPKIVAALDFDVRHKLTANLDIESDPVEPGAGWRNLFADAGINLLFNAQSGTPYTPVRIYDEVTQLSVANTVIGDLNSRYKPWNVTLDLKARKVLKVYEKSQLELQLYIYNLLNRYNPSTVYLGTGDPYITGYLNTESGQKLSASDQVLYELAERNPLNFDNPRMIRFGAVLSF